MHFLYSSKKGLFHNTPAGAHALLGGSGAKLPHDQQRKWSLTPQGVNCHYVTFYLSLAAVSPRTHFLSQTTLNYPGPKTAILLKNYQVIYLCIYTRLCQNPQSYSRLETTQLSTTQQWRNSSAMHLVCPVIAYLPTVAPSIGSHMEGGGGGALLCRNDIEQIKPGETFLNKSNII